MQLALTDLRPVSDVPRLLDLRLAEALGFGQPRDIRQLIKRNEPEMSRHGEVCGAVPQTSPNGGRPGLEYWLNEPQALLISMLSRTARAADVRAELIRVFMEWRRAHESAPKFDPAPASGYGGDAAVAILRERRELIKEARLLFGEARAAKLWPVLGLPEVPGEPEAEASHSSVRCLRRLLSVDLGRGDTIGALIVDALALETFENEIGLSMRGIKTVAEEPAGVVIANGHAQLLADFDGTPWARGRWSHALKRLPGAHSVGPQRFAGATHRGVFIPEDTLMKVLSSD